VKTLLVEEAKLWMVVPILGSFLVSPAKGAAKSMISG
jgi:hypothetical protein